jgi:pimeloyl-ACP methyl ester carboxylesterase/DNA-binding CsgD family transcriptional regulator
VSFVPIACRLARVARRTGVIQVRQSIRLTRSADGTTIAWAEAGSGPALVKASNWLTHLEHDAESPLWRHWVRFFAQHFRFIRYDERGCGMSQRDVATLSVEASTEDLAAVVEAAQPRAPFVLLGISQGGAAAIRYAVAHPERISHLVLYGAYAQGRAKQSDRQAEEAQRARIALTRSGWGQNNPVYRQLFTSRFVPQANDEHIRWFNELCRVTATADMAARIMEFRLHVDETEWLPRVAVPALVLHARGDEAVSPAQSRLLAERIPGATLVELESRNHILLETEPAWARFKHEVLQFTGRSAEGAGQGDARLASLSARERDILERVAQGFTNVEIGRQLFISDKTVRNHITRIFEKLGVHSRAQAIVLALQHGLAVR